MSLARSVASAKEMLTVGADLLLRRYPAAIYRRPPAPEELPVVFCFHSATPAPFEELLVFLKSNGYQTLVADEFYDLVMGKGGADPGRSVLLTFDDGVGQVWSVVYPLLKKYDLRASCFLIPGRIRERPARTYYPNLEDVWAGRAALGDVVARDESDQPLATWDEIATMHDSGVIDFQCHTWDHRLIFTSPKVVDFVSPQALATFHPFEFSMFRDEQAPGAFERPPLGSPVYTTAPRMSAAPQYRPDPELATICVEYVEARGGAAFFDRPDWRRTLFALAGAHAAPRPSLGDYESDEEREEAIAFDLERAKAAIEARLSGKRVRHLAFPWGVGSAAVVEAARRTGYATCFWNRVDGRLVNRVGDDPFRLTRIGEDFVRSLPGEGRVPLTQVVTRKLGNRFRRGAPYLSH